MSWLKLTSPIRWRASSRGLDGQTKAVHAREIQVLARLRPAHIYPSIGFDAQTVSLNWDETVAFS
jgi:hypothetical protein